MAEIRNAFNGTLIAELHGALVRKSSFFNNDALVQIEGNDIKRFATGELLATLSGNDIKSAFGGTLLAEISQNEIRNPFNGELLYTINGSASQIEKSALAVTAMILDRRL